jgi:hypothetical protein
VREILENENRYMDETLDRMERLDNMDTFRGWDMGDLIARANLLDVDYRHQARDHRRQKAAQRLCRIIAGMYTRAVIAGDVDECDRLADALVVATRTWCNG